MLSRTIVGRLIRPSTSKLLCGNRFFSSSNEDDDGGSKKGPKPTDFLSPETLKALDKAATEVAQAKPEAKRVKNELLQKLRAVDQESFKCADQIQLASLLEDAKKLPMQQETKMRPTWWGDKRQSDRAIAAIRQEVFHKFRQQGKNVDEAHQLAAKVTEAAEEELNKRRQQKFRQLSEEEEEKQLQEKEKDTEYQRVFRFAQYLMEQEFGLDRDAAADGDFHRQAINPDTSLARIFVADPKAAPCDASQLQERPLPFWRNWDDEKARVTNLSFGPKNAFEEQILWTEKGAMWPYPINNEYRLGPEEHVSFLDHVFLEPYLARYNLPKTGPVAHFMELVCVGLSKNPYMTVEKKRQHLDWFATFFNKEMISKVDRLHEIEQQAALTV